MDRTFHTTLWILTGTYALPEHTAVN